MSQEKKKSGFLKKIWNFIVVVVVGIMLLSFIASDDDSSSSQSVSSNSQSDNYSEDTAPAETGVQHSKVGEAASINGIDWTVTKATLESAVKDQFDDIITPVDESTTLVLVKGKVVNRNKEIDLELGDMILVDADGAEYAEHQDSMGLFFDQLSRNVPKMFSAFFEMPKDAPKPVSLKVTDADLFSDGAVYIDIIE